MNEFNMIADFLYENISFGWTLSLLGIFFIISLILNHRSRKSCSAEYFAAWFFTLTLLPGFHLFLMKGEVLYVFSSINVMYFTTFVWQIISLIMIITPSYLAVLPFVFADKIYAWIKGRYFDVSNG